jgi:hypothetical protein
MSGHGWNLTRHCRIPISHSAVTFSYNSGLNQVLCFVLCRTSRDSTTPLQFYLYSRFLPSESSDINRYTADNLIFCHNTDKLFTKIAGNCTEIRRSSSPTFCYIGGKGGGIEGIVQPIYVFYFYIPWIWRISAFLLLTLVLNFNQAPWHLFSVHNLDL